MVQTLLGVDRQNPQTAYYGIQKSLQQEWAFMQQATPDIEDAFGPVEDALRDYLLLALFQGIREGTLGWGVTQLTVEQAGLALPYLTKTAPENWTASCVIIGHLVAALRGWEEFWTADHAAIPREGRGEVQRRNMLRSEAALEDTITVSPAPVARFLKVCDEDGGVADSAAVQSKWHRNGCAVMVIYPLPVIRPISPRPTQTL